MSEYSESVERIDDSVFYGKNYARSANELVKKRVADLMSTHIRTDAFYKDVLRGLLSQFNLGYVDSQDKYKEIDLHHGRQDRAVAKKFQENNLILPYATIFQSSVDEDKQKRKYEPVLVYKTVWNAATNRAERIVSYPDVPVVLDYTLSLWSKFVSDMDQISSNIRSKFNPHFTVKIPDTQTMKCFLSEETDRSVVEVNDKEDRLIRKEFVIKVEAYIPSPKFIITNSNEIRKIKTFVVIDDDSIPVSGSPTGGETYYITWE